MTAFIVPQLLDGLEGREEPDLMAEFCRDLPLAVICEMLGLPAQDHASFKAWLGGLKDMANIGAVVRAIPDAPSRPTMSSKRGWRASQANTFGCLWAA